ncbi:septum formation initiator family protein [Streptomyces sp. NPDC047046]|uniref:FtsB family cell division protein n=1 Tax=Streptomyces sp. NPDC047046 TaxID=3155378 RepID=UPI0033C42E20
MARKNDGERFSTATRLRVLGEQTAARVYRSQSRRQARRSRLTGRAAILVLVLCALIVALAYPMRQYIAQRDEIAQLQRELKTHQDDVERLRDEKARWQDPAYARQRIRERLHYVLPGETGYTALVPGAASAGPAPQDAAATRPWYTNVLGGIDEADRAAALR